MLKEYMTVTLTVEGVSILHLNIPRVEEEEKWVRDAVKLLNRKAAQYKERCMDSNFGDPDFFAMAAIQVARAYCKLQEERDEKKYEHSVKELNKHVQSFLDDHLLNKHSL
ncbi:MAG TPA: hypothetical protein DDY68_00445 [Porphyromonadaceae bacterium]|nr:hypothetical protein [Porphyromonadaceae bacterium]